MKQYLTYILLGILLALVYQKPVFFMNLSNNKILKIILILLNAYIAKTYGMMNAVITSLIIIVLLHNDEGFIESIKQPSKNEMKQAISEAKKMLDKATDAVNNQNEKDEETEEEKEDKLNGYGEDGWRKKTKENFVSKMHHLKPTEFSSPCQIDLDRYLKIKSEKTKLNSTRQLNGHTNDGFKIQQKQLY
tara:strand:- start:258 stop:827 length:570 start_codon:yes stop_codon:yes gene_type:complete